MKYDTILNRHIEPKLGKYYPLAITNQLLEEFTEELLYEDMLAAKTVKDILTVLRSILKYSAR